MNFLDRAKPYIEILKLKASVIDVSVMLATCSVAGEIDVRILPAVLSGVLMHSSGDIINDIYDREIDRICKPLAVIPSGRMGVGPLMPLPSPAILPHMAEAQGF